MSWKTVDRQRPFTVILSLGVTVMLLGCGLFNDGEQTPKRQPVEESPESERVTPTAVSEGQQLLGTAPIIYLGSTSLEERILAYPVIARVRLDSTTSTVESGSTYEGQKYLALLEFNFSVQQYLKGSGATNIVAVWAAAPLFDTRQEAENALPDIVAARDNQWDDREAIVFLQQDYGEFLSSTEQADRYYLEWGGTWTIPDDGYSIASLHNKLWLPATAAVGAPSQPSGDQQNFLLDEPLATGTASTITLGEMESRIAGVAAKLDASDGSEEYLECVPLTYEAERRERHYWETYPDRSGSHAGDTPPHEHEFDSGLAVGSILYEDELGFGQTADNLNRYWLDGGDVDLFNVEFGEAVPYDWSGDGVNDVVNFTRKVLSVRPLPEGVYRFHYNDQGGIFLPCDGYTNRYEWTVTVDAPEGTLHEAFFDPVTDGTAVAADSTTGVLDPATFTDATMRRRPLSALPGNPAPGSRARLR